ncbi:MULTISPECIES: hypothetical protein [Nocardia]|uniref:hypothetical protein n=1 Tax=Nocardia TaxID=1817 RepID=UPI000AB16F1D|nr:MULTISPECIES: hypothetical protein [Nocardia]MCC3316770.1 hypothetical protein [Nocardia africana]
MIAAGIRAWTVRAVFAVLVTLGLLGLGSSHCQLINAARTESTHTDSVSAVNVPGNRITASPVKIGYAHATHEHSDGDNKFAPGHSTVKSVAPRPESATAALPVSSITPADIAPPRTASMRAPPRTESTSSQGRAILTRFCISRR